MPVNDGSFNGWPFVNHAMEVRGTQTERGTGRNTIVYPRRKYTYLVEFFFNPNAIAVDRMQTDLLVHIRSGRLLATLRNIDHPKPSFKTEKLRSYNKNVIIPTMAEYAPSSVGFHDDNSSVAMALWREYRAYYQYEGRLGENEARSGRMFGNGTDGYRGTERLAGAGIRGTQTILPSMGMTMRPNSGRHFFDAIRIYDLGADPDSVNVYTYLYPMITAMDHDNLDYEDRPGQVGINMTFEYEGYYHLIGMNNAQFHEVIEAQLGFRPTSTSGSVDGHARMTPPSASVTGGGSIFNNIIGGLGGILGSLGDLAFPNSPPAATGVSTRPPASDFTKTILPQTTQEIQRLAGLGVPLYVTPTGYLSQYPSGISGSNNKFTQFNTASPEFVRGLLEDRGLDPNTVLPPA